MAEETPATRRCAFEGCSEPSWTLETENAGQQSDAVSRYCVDHGVLVTLAGRASRAEPANDPSLVPCAVSDCPAFEVGGNIESRVDRQRIGQYCPFHGALVIDYGQPKRPAVLNDRPPCRHRGPEGAPCREPAIANELCIRHVSTNGRMPIRKALTLWEAPENGLALSAPVEDTWRVLAELKNIAHRGTANPAIPVPDGEAVFGVFSALAAGVVDHLTRLSMAHAMSPYSLALTLGTPAEQVRLHLDHLKTTSLVELNRDFELPPRTLIVVRELRISRWIAWRWRIRRARQAWWPVRRYWPGHVVVDLPENLPRGGQIVVEPVLHGPGVVDVQHQGDVLALTHNGHVELRAWEERLRAEEDRKRSERLTLGLAIAATLIGLASLVSIIADAPDAVKTIKELLVGS